MATRSGAGGEAIARTAQYNFEHLPDWLHGKTWSSPHQATIMCAAPQAPMTQPVEGHTLTDTFLAFPVLKSMAALQWELDPDDYPIADDADDAAAANGNNPLVTKRHAPASLVQAIEGRVKAFLVCFQCM
jgi:hypothetical protein